MASLTLTIGSTSLGIWPMFVMCNIIHALMAALFQSGCHFFCPKDNITYSFHVVIVVMNFYVSFVVKQDCLVLYLQGLLLLCFLFLFCIMLVCDRFVLFSATADVQNMKKHLFAVSTIYHMTCFQARSNDFNFQIRRFSRRKIQQCQIK